MKFGSKKKDSLSGSPLMVQCLWFDVSLFHYDREDHSVDDVDDPVRCGDVVQVRIDVGGVANSGDRKIRIHIEFLSEKGHDRSGSVLGNYAVGSATAFGNMVEKYVSYKFHGEIRYGIHTQCFVEGLKGSVCRCKNCVLSRAVEGRDQVGTVIIGIRQGSYKLSKFIRVEAEGDLDDGVVTGGRGSFALVTFVFEVEIVSSGGDVIVLRAAGSNKGKADEDCQGQNV